MRQIAENAGVDGSIVVGRLIDQKSVTFGFNAQTGEYEDMLKAGRISDIRPVQGA